jgi:hypothetical protein
MMNGNSANFDRRLTKLENSKLGVPASLAGFRPPTITVHEGEDEDKIIKEMEARGEIPPLENFPAGRVRVIVHRIISPPNGERNWPWPIRAIADASRGGNRGTALCSKTLRCKWPIRSNGGSV